MQDIRKSLGASQGQFARMIGLSVDMVREYEQKGSYNPRIDRFFSICCALKISPNKLLGWKGRR